MLKILYLEDDPNDAHLVDRYIHVTPHEIKIVDNLTDAFALMEIQPDLILVDLLLAKAREGYNFVREVRNQGYQQPIIAVTGLALPGDIEQCYEVGCNEVLSKPYTIDQLAQLLNKYA